MQHRVRIARRAHEQAEDGEPERGGVILVCPGRKRVEVIEVLRRELSPELVVDTALAEGVRK